MSSPISSIASDTAARSSDVATALTSGWAWARLVSMDRMRAWAWGLRSTLPCSIPGSETSAPYMALPVTLSNPSCLTGSVPTTLYSPGGVLVVVAI